MDREALLDRARTRGVNPFVYWFMRAWMQPLFHGYLRLERIGREHIPARGPVIFASNHRSFLDPFVIAVMARRPIYFVAKKEIFDIPVAGRILSVLGAFPIDRGSSDHGALDTAKAILARGDAVLIFPEGTRTRPGALGRAKRGVGRLALETGAPVVPIAVIGTESVRRGWRFRPHKVRIRAGRPVTFPRVERPSSRLAAAATDRIWPLVELQWEWLGGLPRVRSAAVAGSGPLAAAAEAGLTRAGLEVERAPDPGAVDPAAHDLFVLTGPPGERLPDTRAGVVVLAPEGAPDLDGVPEPFRAPVAKLLSSAGLTADPATRPRRSRVA